jgi:hypothetical protein
MLNRTFHIADAAGRWERQGGDVTKWRRPVNPRDAITRSGHALFARMYSAMYSLARPETSQLLSTFVVVLCLVILAAVILSRRFSGRVRFGAPQDAPRLAGPLFEEPVGERALRLAEDDLDDATTRDLLQQLDLVFSGRLRLQPLRTLASDVLRNAGVVLQDTTSILQGTAGAVVAVGRDVGSIALQAARAAGLVNPEEHPIDVDVAAAREFVREARRQRGIDLSAGYWTEILPGQLTSWARTRAVTIVSAIGPSNYAALLTSASTVSAYAGDDGTPLDGLANATEIDPRAQNLTNPIPDDQFALGSTLLTDPPADVEFVPQSDSEVIITPGFIARLWGAGPRVATAEEIEQIKRAEAAGANF